MKARIRVPTKEQYAYIEAEVEFKEDGVDRVVQTYYSIKDAIERDAQIRGNGGLGTGEFNTWLDKYLNDGTGDADKYAAMNAEQQRVIQCIKRSLKRIKVKE